MDELQYGKTMMSIFKSISGIRCKFLGGYKFSRVYHYTSPHGLLGIIGNDASASLRFSKYNSMNDREERLDIVNQIKHYSETIPRTKKTEEFIEFIENFQISDKSFITKRTETSNTNRFFEVSCDTYICCFSKEDDLLPMWNYYTKSKSYEGYSIGFSSKYFQYESCIGKGYSIELHNVIYSKKEKREILSGILKPFEEIYYELDPSKKRVVKEYLQTELDKYQFLFKNECFSHEKEVRAILQVPKDFDYEGSMLKKDFCESHGYIVPYIEFKDLGSAIESVRIAPLFEKEIAIANVKEFLHEKDHKNISVKSSKVPIRF